MTPSQEVEALLTMIENIADSNLHDAASNDAADRADSIVSYVAQIRELLKGNPS